MGAEEFCVVHLRRPGNRAAIVFVHGFHGNATTTWSRFPDLLGEDHALSGWDVYSLGYSSGLRLDLAGIWSADPDISRIAKLLSTRAALGELQEYESLTFVAHSMGGLVIQRALVDDAALRERIGHVFLFGTPSGGLIKASLVSFFKRQLRDMSEGGAFIQDLRSRWETAFGATQPKAHPFKFVVTAGDRDEFVPPRSSIEPFSSFSDVQIAVVPGNHLQIVRAETATDLSVQLLKNTLVGKAAPAGPWNSARVAVERRRFQEAIDQLYPTRASLDPSALVQLALALDGVGRDSEALEVLASRNDPNTDAMGVLAGRIKRRWVAERDDRDAARSRELYADAYGKSVERHDWGQAYYHGINVTFLDLAWKEDVKGARENARRVLRHCSDAAREELLKDRKWRLATEGEARLVLGEFDAAVDGYRAALTSDPCPGPREIDSMYQQATLLVSIVGTRDLAERLDRVFRGDDA